MPKIVPKSIQTCFEHVLGQTFRKFFAQFSMEGRVFENFQKNQKVFKISKTFKITKMPKIVPKSIQTCFKPVLGQIFRKLFAQFSMEGRVFENFQKNKKIFKTPKTTKLVPKSIQTSFERVLGQTFRKIFAQFSMEGRVFENFRKNQKLFKFPKTFKISKMPKIVPKSIQTYFERLLGQIFRTVFAQFSTEGRLLENFQKKSKSFQNFKNAQNRSQKYPNVF